MCARYRVGAELVRPRFSALIFFGDTGEAYFAGMGEAFFVGGVNFFTGFFTGFE